MRSIAYKHYVLGILTVVLMSSGVDRIALGVLLEAIKADFGVSDTQMGFLGGIAFTLFYAIAGLPIARWADRGNRVTVIALCCTVWSAAVALCGLAGSFVQLLLIRVAVAVGEAGCVPTSFSLIADYFNRAERPRATAIYSGVGSTLALIAGYFLGGWLNDHYGWRMTFVVLGVPGLFLALLVWLTLKEPRRARAAALGVGATGEPASTGARPHPAIAHPTIRAVCTILWASVTFRRLLLCLSGMLFFNFGIAQWLAPFFIRSHGFTAGQVGLWLAIVFAVTGPLGAYAGGALASRYAAHNEPLQLRMVAIAVSCAGAAGVLTFLAPGTYTAFVLFGLHAFALSANMGPLFATLQTLVPDRMRAMAFAIAYLVGNLLGTGLGPLAVGVLSDLYQVWALEESLRYALVTLSPGYFIVAWFAWRGGASVAGDIAAAGGISQAGPDSGAVAVGHQDPAQGWPSSQRHTSNAQPAAPLASKGETPAG